MSTSSPVRVRISHRDEVPDWLAWGSPIFTVIASLVVGAIPLLVLGVNPIAAYRVMFINTLTTKFGITEMLVKFIPLVMAGIAVYLPLRAGLWNIGAGGQFVVGGIIATWIALTVQTSSYILLPLMFIGGAFAGAIWGLVPGYLRAKWNVNEIIVSLLMTFIAVELLGYVVREPLQGEVNFPRSALLPSAAKLPSLGTTRLHAGIIFAILAIIGVFTLMRWTQYGVKIRIVGSNPSAAYQSGISTFWIFVATMAIGGLIAGVAGMSEVSGIYTRLQPGFSQGYGFTAIVIALLGRNGVLRVVLASLFFAVLFVGGSSLTVLLNVPASLVEIIQALVILFLITAEAVKRFEINVSFGQSTEAA